MTIESWKYSNSSNSFWFLVFMQCTFRCIYITFFRQMYIHYFNIFLPSFLRKILLICESWVKQNMQIASENRVVITIEAYDFEGDSLQIYLLCLKIKKRRVFSPNLKKRKRKTMDSMLVKSQPNPPAKIGGQYVAILESQGQLCKL